MEENCLKKFKKPNNLIRILLMLVIIIIGWTILKLMKGKVNLLKEQFKVKKQNKSYKKHW